MSEDKNFTEDELGVNNDTDFAESSAGIADDNYDGDADCLEERLESYTQEIEDVLKGAKIPTKKINLSKTAVGVLSSVITLVVCIVAVAIAYNVSYNKYNSNKDGYLPTLEDLAADNSMSVERVKEIYSLPKDMRSDTLTAIALNYMPAGLYVEFNYRMPFDMSVEAMGLKDDERINADMRYGDFLKILDEIEIESLTTQADVVEEENAQEPEAEAEGAATPEE